MSRAQDYANSVSSLYAQIGEARAREAANKGAIWSGALANIGDFVAQYPERKAKMEEIKNRAAMTELEKQKLQHQIDQDKRDADEDQKIRDLFSTAAQEFGQAQQRGTSGVDPRFDLPRTNPNGMAPYFAGVGGIGPPQGASPPTPAPTQMRTSPLPSPSEILRTIGPKKGIPIINGLAALRQDPQGDPEKSLKLLQQVANGLNALPEDLRAQAYPEIVKSFEQRGIVKPGMLQAEYSPEYWKFIMGTGQEPPKGGESGFTLSPGQTRFGPDGKPLANVPPVAGSSEGGFTLTPGGRRYDANGNLIASVPERPPASADNKMWVYRDGKPIRISESEYRPGDLPSNTREQGRPVTSGDANRLTDFDSSLSDVDVLTKTLGSEANATGISAQVGAALPNWATNLTGWGVDAKKKQAVIDRVKQVIGKALEGGVLRKEDEAKYAKILPTIGDPPPVVKSKLAGLKAAIAQRKATLLENLSDAGYETGKFEQRSGQPAKADPLGIR